MLLSVQEPGFAAEHAQKALDDFAHHDDVFCDDFTSAVILQSSQSGVDVAAVATKLAESRRFEAIYTTEPAFLAHDSIPQGPYFIRRGKSIHQAWKLYEDHLDAFVVPTIADDVANPTTR